MRSHKARIAPFLAATRHFRDALRDKSFAVGYHALGDSEIRPMIQPDRLKLPNDERSLRVASMASDVIAELYSAGWGCRYH